MIWKYEWISILLSIREGFSKHDIKFKKRGKLDKWKHIKLNFYLLRVWGETS